MEDDVVVVETFCFRLIGLGTLKTTDFDAVDGGTDFGNCGCN